MGVVDYTTVVQQRKNQALVECDSSTLAASTKKKRNIPHPFPEFRDEVRDVVFPAQFAVEVDAQILYRALAWNGVWAKVVLECFRDCLFGREADKDGLGGVES